MRPAELEQAHKDQVRRVGVMVGAVMLMFGIVIGYTIGYYAGKFL